MPRATLHPGVGAVPAAEWDALCCPGIERHAYLAAVERAGIAGFDFRAITVSHRGRLIAAAPAFLTDYAMEGAIGAVHPRLAAIGRRVAPRLMTQRMAVLGSPCTETATIHLAWGLDAYERAAAAAALIDGLERMAREAHAGLVVLKDLGDGDARAMAGALADRGFGRMAGQPAAVLPIAFGSIDEYLAGLSPGTRRDMRRKLRLRGDVTVEQVRDPAAILGPLMALYQQTLARAEARLEVLTEHYFRNVLAALPDTAFLTLYRHDGDLVAANLLLEEDGLLLDKYFCMDGPRGRALNLYFLSWFENIGHCLKHGLVRYQAGQAAAETKRRLGCRLEPATIAFRHRNPILNRLFATIAGGPEGRAA